MNTGLPMQIHLKSLFLYGGRICVGSYKIGSPQCGPTSRGRHLSVYLYSLHLRQDRVFLLKIAKIEHPLETRMSTNRV